MFRKVRRLCIDPRKDKEPKMHSLYECTGKVDTGSSNMIWFLDEPKVGEEVYGVSSDDRVSPYMKGQAFRYAEFHPFEIDNVYMTGFVVCHYS